MAEVQTSTMDTPRSTGEGAEPSPGDGLSPSARTQRGESADRSSASAADSSPERDIHRPGSGDDTAGGDHAAPVHRSATPSGLFRAAPLGQAMGIYLPATAAFRLTNLVRIILLTWTMTRQQFGLLNMILLVVNVLTPLCSFGLAEAVARYVPQHESRGTLRGLLRVSLVLTGIAAAFSVGVIVIFASRLGEFFFAQVSADAAIRAEFRADAPALASISAVVIALLVVYFYLLAILKGLRMFTALSLMEIVHGLGFLGLSIVAIAVGRLSALTLTVFYGASLMAPIVIFGGGLVIAARRWQDQSEREVDRAVAPGLVRFGFWAAWAGLIWQVLQYYPQWYLNRIHGNEAVAVFSPARQVAQFILTGAVAVVSVVMSAVTRTWETAGRDAALRQWSLGFRVCGFALLIGCGLVALARGWVMALFHDDYAAGADVLPLQLLFFLLGAHLAFLAAHFQLLEKSRHLFWPWAFGVAANLLLAFWLNPPRLPGVQDAPFWQALRPITTSLFLTGFSDPAGLGSASWCGVFAIGAALGMCLVLLRAERVRLDRGCRLIIAFSVVLALRPALLSAGLALLALVALGTSLVFTADERREVIARLRQSIAHLPRLMHGSRRGHG